MGLFSGGNSDSKTSNADNRATATDDGFAVSSVQTGKGSSGDVVFENLSDEVFAASMEFASNALATGAQTAQAANDQLAAAYETANASISDKLKEAEAGAMTYIVPIIIAVVLPVIGLIAFLRRGK